MSEVRLMMTLKSLPVSRISRSWHYLKTKAGFLSKIIFGSNNFLDLSPDKRRNFSEVLEAAEKGEAIGSLNPIAISKSVAGMPGSHASDESPNHQLRFSEHRIENDKGHILEMLQIAKGDNRSEGGKNIIMYFGGRTDNFAYSTKHVLDQFWALDAVDEFWHVNPRHVSLAAANTSPTYTDLYQDGVKMHAYIRSKNPGANITIYGMCAGSPVACKVADLTGEKFFSDRSFTKINDVVDQQIDNLWIADFAAMLLWPIRALRRLFVYMSDFSPQQDELMYKLDPTNRDLHSIMPSKKLTTRIHDSMTKGSSASLHKSPRLLKENEEFDQAFIAVCTHLLKGTRNDSLASDSKKISKYIYMSVNLEVTISDEDKSLLRNILLWHKDRKSYIDLDSTKKIRDPHVAWPSMLQGRQSKCNPMWRLNLFASTNNVDQFKDNNLEKHLEVLVKYAYPVSVLSAEQVVSLNARL